jgi:hypothetical protein
VTGPVDLRLSDRTQHRLSWFMEVSLIGLLFVGLDRGSIGIVVNAGVSLLVAQLPPLLREEYDVPIDPALALWLTGAAFLHALGTVGIPGTGLKSFYANVWWWDHMTHALSASVVAAAGYTTARAIDKHSEEISLPPTFMFVFILLLVLAFGVFWEVLEFVIGIGSEQFGTGSVLTQYGLGDTMLDLVFDTVGAVVVATWGTAYLADLSDAIGDRLVARQAD